MRKNIILKFENVFDGFEVLLYNDADAEGTAERKGPFYVESVNADASCPVVVQFDSWEAAHAQFKKDVDTEADMVFNEFS